MKIIFKIILSFTMLSLVLTLPSAAQNKFYTSSGLEMQLSWAKITQAGSEIPSVGRFAPFFNIQTFANYDVNDNIGFFSGLGFRNVGFIYDADEFTRKKYRTYNIGIPFGIKAGNLKKAFAYAGYEIEFPINYKEKTFINEQKSKFNVWFSGRVPVVYHTLLVGVQLPKGLNLKFKYYFSNFFNKDFEEIDQDTGEVYKPYEDLDVNVLFISVGFNLFINKELYFLEF